MLQVLYGTLYLPVLSEISIYSSPFQVSAFRSFGLLSTAKCIADNLLARCWTSQGYVPHGFHVQVARTIPWIIVQHLLLLNIYDLKWNTANSSNNLRSYTWMNTSDYDFPGESSDNSRHWLDTGGQIQINPNKCNMVYIITYMYSCLCNLCSPFRTRLRHQRLHCGWASSWKMC